MDEVKKESKGIKKLVHEEPRLVPINSDTGAGAGCYSGSGASSECDIGNAALSGCL